MRCHVGVLFTPVIQCHVGRAARSLSLVTKTSFSSRLGVLCLDRSSIINSEADLRHHAPMLGNVAPDAPTKELFSP